MKIKYEIMEPPFFKSFYDMNAKEAKEIFNFYTSQIPIRIKYLESFVSKNADCDIYFDYSRESIIKFWDWYGDLLVEQHNNHPVEGNPLNLSFDVLGIGSDFAMYFGELFIKEHPKIHWGYKNKPKSNFFLNRPALLGFQDNVVYCPEHSISMCVRRALEEKNPYEVINIFDIWSKYI